MFSRDAELKSVKLLREPEVDCFSLGHKYTIPYLNSIDNEIRAAQPNK